MSIRAGNFNLPVYPERGLKMTRNCIRTILFLMLSTVLVSCAAPVHLNTIQSVKVQTHGYVQKVENIMVIPRYLPFNAEKIREEEEVPTR